MRDDQPDPGDLYAVELESVCLNMAAEGWRLIAAVPDHRKPTGATTVYATCGTWLYFSKEASDE